MCLQTVGLDNRDSLLFRLLAVVLPSVSDGSCEHGRRGGLFYKEQFFKSLLESVDIQKTVYTCTHTDDR